MRRDPKVGGDRGGNWTYFGTYFGTVNPDFGVDECSHFVHSIIGTPPGPNAVCSKNLSCSKSCHNNSSSSASVVHTCTSSACISQSHSLGPWMNNLGASDHITVERPLQIYHRRPRPSMMHILAPGPAIEVMPDSPLTHVPFQSSALPHESELPIDLRKGMRSTRNPSLNYIALSYHRLSSLDYSCLSSLSSVVVPKTVHMAGRVRGARQNVPNDLLAQMVEALQQMSENLQNLNQSVAPGPSSHTLVQQGPAEYRGLDKSCRRNPSPFQGGFDLNAAIEWVQGMGCTNMKADGVATSESIPHKDFGPQRNFVHERGKDKMYREERKPYFPPVGTRSCISHGPSTHVNAGGSRGRTYKEAEHIKRHCPMARQSMNAIGTGRPQSIGRVVTMFGVEASESDSLTRCGMYEEEVNESQRSYALTGVRRNHGHQGSKPTVGGFQPDVSPTCHKCGRLHYGSTCPGKGNGCFYCKEFEHIKRYCPKLDRRPNVMHVGEARDHGRMVTPSGAGTSGVDDPARESGCGKWCDMYSRFGLLVVIPVMEVERIDVPFGRKLFISNSILQMKS
ncbi:hypothetical protein Lal_00018899 [Lupinus albus]|nr:hypothetical protein Lal_00018899 [Lupinus albus]